MLAAKEMTAKMGRTGPTEGAVGRSLYYRTMRSGRNLRFKAVAEGVRAKADEWDVGDAGGVGESAVSGLGVRNPVGRTGRMDWMGTLDVRDEKVNTEGRNRLI